MKSRIIFGSLLGLLAAAVTTMALVPAARPAGWLSGLLRSLHGAPAAKPAGPPDATAATVRFAPGVTADAQVQEFLQSLAEAVRIHNGAALKSRLSPRYTIDGLPAGYDAPDFFAQAVAKLKGVSEFVVHSIESTGGVRVVAVEFRTSEGTGKTRTFRFDADGRLLSADFFSLQKQGHGM